MKRIENRNKQTENRNKKRFIKKKYFEIRI